MKTYFISDGTCIKIGRSEDPSERLASLQTAHSKPLSLLLTLDGDYERELHDAFADHRINGEWFTAKALASFLAFTPEERLYWLAFNCLGLTGEVRLAQISGGGSRFTLLCPWCNDALNIYQHAGTPTVDKDGRVSVPFSGECGHAWSLVFASHGGHTELRTVITKAV